MGNPFSFSSRLLGHVNVEASLETKEKGLPTYARSNTPPSPKSGEPRVWEQPTSKLGKGDIARLRLATLPKIDAVRMTTSDLAGSGSNNLWDMIAGSGLKSEQTLIISLSGIETVELADASAIPAFHRWLKNRFKDDDDFSLAVCANAERTQHAIQISMITRVLYARGVNYSYGDTFGAALRASTGESSIDDSVVTNAVVTTNESQSSATPNVDLSRLNPDAPGISGGGSRESRDVLSQTEVYERPLAFGADIISINPFKFLPELEKQCKEFIPAGIFTQDQDQVTALSRDESLGFPGE